MDRPITTLFMLMSVDGKISTGATDDLDIDKDFPKIAGVREGLHQYYEIEQTTDLWSLNSGRVQAKLGVNTKEMPDKTPVSFVIIDNDHLNKNGVLYFCSLNSVYTRLSQNSTPNSNATNLHCCQKRCCSFGISSSNASPAFQVQKSIFHQMTKPIQVTVILPLLLAISFSRNDDIHSSISGISNDLIGVIPTIGQ